MIRRDFHRALTALAAGALAGGAHAAQDEFPSKPIKVVIPYPAGGVGDTWTRLVTDQLARKWKQPILIDARPGASTNIGTQYVRNSAPDGYTWLMAGPGLTANPSLFKSAGWNATRDFAGVGVIGYSPLVLVVANRMPAATLREVVAQAKDKPGSVSAGMVSGSSIHFILEALRQVSGAEFLMVPYNGAPPIVTDLAGGTLQLSVLPVAVAMPMVRSGRIRAVAIASPHRHALCPEVPTFEEAGYRDAALVPWYGLVVPRGTPDSIVRQINRETREALKKPEVSERLPALGGDAAPAMTPADIDALIRSDAEKYAALIRRGKIKVES